MKRFHTLFQILCLIIIFGLIGTVNAEILTFEDLYPGYETCAPIPTDYQGFSWAPESLWITKYFYPGSGYDYGTMGKVSLLTGWAQDIWLEDGYFDFEGAYITSAWDSTQDVIVEGWRDDILIHSTTITTYNDKAYWFDFNFTNIDTIWFKPQGTHIDIDNITYKMASVPEPGSILLLGSLLISFIVFKKKTTT